MTRPASLSFAISALTGGLSAWALGPTFRPDSIFKGSALTGWHTVGKAAWKAANGEIAGTAPAPPERVEPVGNEETLNAGGVTFTEPHATAFADIDGDGIPDLFFNNWRRQ